MRTSTTSKAPGTKTCMFCGRWPACLYRDINEKHGERVCEACLEEGTVIKGEDGVYVMNPERLAATEESPDSDTRSSSQRSGARGSAA